MIKAALFDLDGVIVDTEPSYSVFWEKTGNDYNVGVPGFADVIKGTTLPMILGTYFPEEVHQEIISRLNDYERDMEYVIFDGAEDFLKSLAAEDMACAIVTSSNNEKMANLWRQHPRLREYFRCVVTDEKVTRSKPDPEPYLIAAAELGVDPADTWVFEDSYNGLKSGRAAGATVIALATTNPADTLAPLADMVIDSFKGLSPRDLPGRF